MTFCGFCKSHLRIRLTDQGETYHFGGYADIRVLDNAFLLFTAAQFSQSRHERSRDLSVSLSHNVSRVLASASISLILRCDWLGVDWASLGGLKVGLLPGFASGETDVDGFQMQSGVQGKNAISAQRSAGRA
jgi:hypothetical protein